MDQTYKYFWICKTCKCENILQRTKYQAAFEHRPKLPPCKNCGGSEKSSSGGGMPNIDSDLLETWFANPDLYFLEQDEDLIIAGAELGVLKGFLNVEADNLVRARTLGPMIAVKLYDGRFENPEDRKWCIDWLIENKEMWANSTDGYITKKIKPMLKV